MAKFDEKKQLKCSFCGKNQDQVKRLIAGPGVYICDECIDLCSEIIQDEFEENVGGGPGGRHLHKPHIIHGLFRPRRNQSGGGFLYDCFKLLQFSGGATAAL